jgi:hypothetical protein
LEQLVNAWVRWYAEDTLRIFIVERLEKVAGTTFRSLLRNNEGIFQVLEGVDDSRALEWTHLTETPFDPFEGIVNWTHRPFICPNCDVRALTRSFLDYFFAHGY